MSLGGQDFCAVYGTATPALVIETLPGSWRFHRLVITSPSAAQLADAINAAVAKREKASLV